MRAKQPSAKPNVQSPQGGDGIPVVGIGASAGGLEALQTLLNNMPTDSGLAFVVIIHQSPEHVSLLAELLGKCTSMPITNATEGAVLEANQVYVVPPGQCVALLNGMLRLKPIPKTEMPPLPIDYFFCSLARDSREFATGVVLSGTGKDGTRGLSAIQQAGGMVLVQEPTTARYPGMPTSAIENGLADAILPPDAMPSRLADFAHRMLNPLSLGTAEDEAPQEQALQSIFALLRDHTGHDFSSYKPNTIRRRIERRMRISARDTPAQYALLLKESPGEIDALFKELLIGVTCFFRDPEAFQALAQSVLEPLMMHRPDRATIRVWIPGCARGEEAYTVAMLLLECMRKLNRRFTVQVFATDLDADAIEAARRGRYPIDIAVEVPAPLLERYFAAEEGTYRVREEVRKLVVFAVQNVVRDPPFSKVDLLCCRNLLIYLNSDLQQRLLPIYHYALNPDGVLMLGPSESVGGFRHLFEEVDRKWKLYRRKKLDSFQALPHIPVQPIHNASRVTPVPAVAHTQMSLHVASQVETLLLGRFAPPTVVVNERGDIIYIHGRTRDYLEPPTGQAKLNIYAMARPGLQADLAAAMRQAIAHDGEVVCRHVRGKGEGDCKAVELSVVKLNEPHTMRGLLLVTFRPPPEAPPRAEEPRAGAPGKRKKNGANAPRQPASEREESLEHELNYTRETLQTSVEELQTANEEIISYNEELQSTNEELQSTNEELETSKEEMQSLNEELTTVNAELESKVDALTHSSDDMRNLLDSTDVATLFLDMNLNIRRYTKPVTKLFNIIPTDIGRKLADLSTELEYHRLTEDAANVLDSLAHRVEEVSARDGSSYLMRMMPYRTVENLIEGVVITFVNITGTRRAETAGRTARNLLQCVFDTFHYPALVLDSALRVLTANATFCNAFATNLTQTEGHLIYELRGGAWDVARLRELLERIIPEQSQLQDFEVTVALPTLGQRIFRLHARQLKPDTGLPGMILLGMDDVTEQKGQ